MAINQVSQYLIVYDISEPKRLQRVHRRLKKQGLPVQYSVFSVVLSQVQLVRLLDVIKPLLDEREDDLRCYSLPCLIDCVTLGKQFFPDDVLLFTQGVSSLFLIN